jgi:hypothetical protein
MTNFIFVTKCISDGALVTTGDKFSFGSDESCFVTKGGFSCSEFGKKRNGQKKYGKFLKAHGVGSP